MKLSKCLLVATTAAAFAAMLSQPALAHHSFGMFDRSKQVRLVGMVREFQWTSPHSWIQLLVPNAKGGTTEWSIEMGSPAGLLRSGWRPRSLSPGDHVVIVAAPLRDGRPGGSLMSATHADGTIIGK